MIKILRKVMNVKVMRYLVVGGCTTAADFMLYMLLSIKLPIVLSKAISMLLASVCSYVANKNYTFGVRKKTDITYITRFYITFAINIGVNIGVNTLLYSITSYKVISFIFATACGMTANFLSQNFFVFKK